MKKLLLTIVVVFLFQHVAYADEGKKKGKRFAENKGRILGNIDKKLGFLNDFKACVKSADSREEVKSCRLTNKKNMDEFRAARKAGNEERKKLRAARKEERRKQRK